VTFGGLRFLIDPFFAPKGSTPAVPSPYNDFPNPLVELPLPVEDIVRVDAILVTHMHHFDHFDEHASRALPKSLPVFVQNEKEAADMVALGFEKVAALSDEGTSIGDVTLYRTEALHGAGEHSVRLYEEFGLPGEASGCVFRSEGEPVFYLAGDTVWFEGVAETLDRFRPEVVALNAAWAQFPDGTPILMGPEDIETTVRHAPKARFIATHMDAVNHARLDRAGLRAFLRECGFEERFSIPEDGESLKFNTEIEG
jgi:L-ascorbate metabolism protein UlaG (beta-lactamase superfamily)